MMMDRLLHIGVANAIAAAVLALAAVPLARLARRPALTHAICVLVLLKLLTPPLFHVPMFRWHAPTAPVSISRDPTLRPLAWEVIALVPTDDKTIVTTQIRPRVTHAASFFCDRISPARIVFAIWLSGSAISALFIALGLARLRRVTRFAIYADRGIQEQVHAIASRLGLGSPPPLAFVPGGTCPMMIAFFSRPRLLVPRRLWDRLDATQRQTLLLHELAHLRRRDHWVRVLEVLVAVLYWWNPVTWWVRRELREAEEQCCDAWVVASMPQSVRSYMTTLLEAIDFLCERNKPAAMPMLASGMGQFHCLERRLRMVKQQTVRKSLSWRGFAAVCGVAALLPLTPSLAQNKPASDALSLRANQNTSASDAPAEKPAQEYGITFSPDEKAASDASQVKADDLVVTKKWSDRELAARLTFANAALAQAELNLTNGKPEAGSASANSGAIDELQQARATVDQLTAELQAAKARLDYLKTVAQANKALQKPQEKTEHRISVLNDKNEIVAFDGASGKKMWVYQLGKMAPAGAALASGSRVVVTDAAGHTIILDLASGRQLAVINRDPADKNAAAHSDAAEHEARLRALETQLEALMTEVRKLNGEKPQTPANPGEIPRE